MIPFSWVIAPRGKYEMLIKQLVSLKQSERGATAIEYGLIAALIVIAMMAGLNSFADETSKMYQKVSSTIDNAVS